MKIPLSLKGNFKILKRKNSSRRIIAGYASVAVIDSDDQIIPTQVLKKGMESLLGDPNYANVMLYHKNIQIGTILESFGNYKTGVDNKGLFIVCEIRQDIKTADEIWNSIIDGDLNGFSIGCEVLTSHQECDDNKCITILDEINIFEVSVCSQPINKGSGFIVVSKSNYNVCDESNNMGKTMSEEKTPETPENKSEEDIKEIEDPTEAKAEAIELSVEERLEVLERGFNAIQGAIENLTKSIEEKAKAKEDEEEEEEPEEDEEEMSKKSEESLAEVTPEVKSTEPKQDTIQVTLDAILKAITDLQNEKSKEEEIAELRVALKTSNDAIAALEKKVEIVNKAEEPVDVEQKTVQDKQDEPVLEKDSPFVIKRGIITSSKFCR